MEISAISRAATRSDIPALRELWREVFHDTDGYIDLFLNVWFDTELTAVAELDGQIAAAAYLLPVGNLKTPDGERTPCGMVYAVATRESHRGRGLGTLVMRGLDELAERRGIRVRVLCPAEDGLFDFYEKRTDYREYFTADVLEYSIGREPRGEVLTLLSVEPTEYTCLREELLAGTTHIEYHEKTLFYQTAICALRGGLFRIEGGRGAACAVIDVSDDGDVTVRELLCGEDDRDDAAYAVMRSFDATRCTVKTPGTGVRFGMSSGVLSGSANAWYGLAFD
jgi:GNAT superfamily N-acetyltransferase